VVGISCLMAAAEADLRGERRVVRARGERFCAVDSANLPSK